MNLSNFTVGQSIVILSGLLLSFLAVIVIWSYTGVSGICSNPGEVIHGNQLQSTLAEREIDHLAWVTKVGEALIAEDCSTLGVQTDDHKCALGRWLYGENREKIEAQFPTLSAKLKGLEEPHLYLHATANKMDEMLGSKNPERFSYAKQVFKNETVPILAKVRGTIREFRERVST
jgi:methyl-accepting chemotaxis protein